MLTLLGYASDALVLGTYALLARTGRTLPFHVANAFGAPPIIAAEIIGGVWPALVLTGTFCVLGWAGLAKAWVER